MELRTETITNIIQGVSQQADTLAGMSTAKAQENCINSVAEGVVSRMGSTLLAFHPGLVLNDPYKVDRYVNEDEDYQVVIEGGRLRVFNLATGVEATVTGGVNSYFNHVGDAYQSFTAAGPEDYLLIANKERTVAMGAAKSAVRPKWAIAHFRSGGYSTKYILGVVVAGTAYETVYTTPDSSTVANEQYIKTDYLAEALRAAFAATIIPALNAAGKTGFTVSRRGSVILIQSSTHDFEVYTRDGLGDVQFISFKDRIKKLTDLPQTGYANYQVIVAGSDNTKDDDYAVVYVGDDRSGDWEETIFPDTVLGVNPATMPLALVNTGVNTFVVQTPTWAQRVSGDGIKNSLDPMFVGNKITSMDFISGRLVIATEGSVSLSSSVNIFNHFPDTARTVLATDPMGWTVTNGERTSIKQTVVANQKLFLWADKVQSSLESGDFSLKQDTSEARPSTRYAFDGRIKPQAVGANSVVMASGRRNFIKMLEVIYRQGRPEGEIELSGHVKRLLRGRPRGLCVTDDPNNYALTTTYDPLVVYMYDFYNQGNERLQSAWNTWRWWMPTKVVTISLSQGCLYLLLQWPNGVSVERVVLDDIGDEDTERYPLRIDHRISETSATYSALTGWTVTTPYQLGTEKFQLIGAWVRESTSSGTFRGLELPVERIDDFKIRIPVMDPSLKFYVGSKPTAFRKFPQFYLRDDRGVVQQDRLTIASIAPMHSGSAAYSVVVTYLERQGAERTVRQDWKSRIIGDPTWSVDQVPVEDGVFEVDVDEDSTKVEITILNDTVFPAKWPGATFKYNNSKRSG